MSTAWRRFGLHLCLAALAAVLAVVATPGTGTAMGDTRAVVDPVGAGPVPGQIEALALNDYSNTYGGLVVTDQETHIDVYLTSLNATVEAPLSALAPSGEISFLTTPNSVATLGPIDSQIFSDWQALQAAGIELIGFGGDVYSGTIDLQVENATTAQVTMLDERYGASHITVQSLTPSEVPSPYYDRTSDYSPWRGSDSIGSIRTYNGQQYLNGCSSGFSGHSNATGDLLITATHCFYPAESIYNYIQTASGWQGSGLYVGSVGAFQSQAYGDTDTELIGASGAGQVWLGPIGGAYPYPVSGYTNNPMGDYVCTDGSYDGELGSNNAPVYCGSGTGTGMIQIVQNGDNTPPLGWCQDQSYAADETTTNPPYELPLHTCHLIEVQSTSGQAVAGPGDSGGPVFRFTNGGSTLEAVGVISGGLLNVQCPYNTEGGRRECGNEMWYSAINSTLSQWGIALDTSS